MSADAITGTRGVAPELEKKPLALHRLSWQWAAFGAIALAACGHLIIKAGLSSVPHAAATASLVEKGSLYLFHSVLPVGLMIYGLGTLLWIKAVSSRNISFLYPLTALNYVIVSIGGRLFFNEAVSARRWVGIAVVVLGVALLQRSVREDQP